MVERIIANLYKAPGDTQLLCSACIFSLGIVALVTAGVLAILTSVSSGFVILGVVFCVVGLVGAELSWRIAIREENHSSSEIL